MTKYIMRKMQNEIQPLRIYLIVAIIMGSSTVAAIIVVPLIGETIEKIVDHECKAIDICHVILYLSTGWLIVNWIWSCWFELNILTKWLDPGKYTPPTAYLEAALSILIAAFLIFLIYLVKHIEWYVGIFTIYALFNLYAGGIHTLSEVGTALNASEKKLKSSISKAGEKSIYESAVEKALTAIRLHWVKNLENLKTANGFLDYYKLEKWHHWFRNPYFFRLFIVFLASSIAFMISLTAKLRTSYIWEILSYCGIILTILGSEFWITIWRMRRNRKLRKADELLKTFESIKENE